MMKIRHHVAMHSNVSIDVFSITPHKFRARTLHSLGDTMWVGSTEAAVNLDGIGKQGIGFAED
jgi:hypothetical protein